MSIETLGDIALIPDSTGFADCVFLSGAVQCDQSLQTAVTISIFTDAEDTEGVTTQTASYATTPSGQ